MTMCACACRPDTGIGEAIEDVLLLPLIGDGAEHSARAGVDGAAILLLT